jgi:hypothetical protein
MDEIKLIFKKLCLHIIKPMKFYKPITLLIIISISSQLSLFAQSALISVDIINAANKTTTFSAADLNALPQTTLSIKAEDGTVRNYTGVDIQLILNKAGVSFGKDVRRQTLTSYMLIKAGDNYSVIYALAEVDSLFSNKKMILASLEDGKPIPSPFGPLQVIATDEKVHARLIRQVTSIIIKNALDNK